MHLVDKLNSIVSDDVLSIGRMLPHTHVSIDSLGQRVVSIDGYAGTAKISDLASVLLKSRSILFL